MLELPVLSVNSCDNCCACCVNEAMVPVIYWLGKLAHKDSRKLPGDLLEELQRIKISYGRQKDGWPCIWLDQQTGLCKHYEYRPPVCVKFEIGGSECLTARMKWSRSLSK